MSNATRLALIDLAYSPAIQREQRRFIAEQMDAEAHAIWVAEKLAPLDAIIAELEAELAADLAK